jgi:hypothetical protein
LEPCYARGVNRTTKPSPVAQFLDVLADVIADRVATKLAETTKPTSPQMAPKWLPGTEKPVRRRRGLVPKGEDPKWTAQKALRDSGFLTFGDPGYDGAAKEYVERQRQREAEVRRRARMRTAVKLFDKLVGLTPGVGRPSASFAPPRRRAP